MKKNHLSKKKAKIFWTVFFGLRLGDIVETKVKRNPLDSYHKVHLEIIGTYPDPFHLIRTKSELHGRVVKDFDNVGLLNKTYLIRTKDVKGVVKKCKRK